MATGPTPSVLETVEHLAVHEHLALLYSSHREQFDVMTPFLRMGLERGERCLYLVDDTTSTAIVAKLRAEGIEVDSALEAKSLVILHKKRGYFDPEWMIRILKESTDEAIADGFSALRIANEMSWVLGKEGGLELLTDFEAMLNYFFPQYPALGICQYNLQRFKPETVKEVVLGHPNVVVGGTVRKNPMEGSNVRLNLVITEHQKVEEQLRRSETRLAEAQRLAHMGSYDIDVHTGESKWSDETFRILGLDSSVNKPSVEELLKAVHPEDKIRVERTILSAIKEGSPFEVEFRIVVGRSVKHVLGLGQVERSETGEVTRMYGTIMDITERKRILDALQTSEERYRRLLASVTDYVYSVSIVEGRATSTSHGAGCLAVTGYSPEDHFADPYLWYTMVYPDDRILVTEEAEKRMRGESTKTLEHRIIHKNGSIRWVRNTIVPRHDQHGKLVGYDGLVEDITERKAVDEAVRQSESQYRVMIDEFDGMVLVCSKDFRIEFMNGKFIERAGRDATGQNCRDLLNELSEVFPWCIDERVTLGQTVRWEVQHPKDGRWYSMVNKPIHRSDGSISLLAMVEDISEKKRVEAALKNTRDLFSDLLLSVHDWIWEIDAHGIYTFSSRKVKELLGYEPEEVIGKNYVELLMPFEVERISSILHECVAARKPIVSLENIYKHKDGHPVVMETSGKPFFDEDGNLIGYRGVDNDITDRKKQEREKEKSR
jgi:PAS domain S-box-containing protein